MNPILDMILEGAPYGAVADAVSAALATLFERDTHLFAVDANERSITHRLAVHLAPHFPGWDIDCEYNRDGYDPKMVHVQHEEGITESDGSRVFPDIIVHRRGTQENLLVIEVKKSASSRADDIDLAKLAALRHELGYQYGLFLRLRSGVTTPGIERIEWR